MRALRSFTVRPRLPEPLAPLRELALNLRWSWDSRTRDLFRYVDPEAWDASFHDPLRLLGMVERERLEHLAADPGFMGLVSEMSDELTRYLDGPRWFQRRDSSALRSVAYFSPEFGIAEALPQYSGGLGVLAGDHLKAASGLGIPVTGVGLMYRQGYFRQRLNAEAWQEECLPDLDPHAMPVELVDGLEVSVDLAGAPLVAHVWLARIGRVRLYLLDSDVEGNDEEMRTVTDRLYGGDTEHRLRQEIVLGVGGVRTLERVEPGCQVFHTNEGHAGFLGLERIRKLISDEGLRWGEALEVVRAGSVFTTHTPVPAGIDRFPRELMECYFAAWAEECGISIDSLMALGHFPGEPAEAPFNMAVMSLRLASRSNGVSVLHGATSRRMFHGLWPDVPEDEVPISSITNGVHGRSWISVSMDDLLSKYVSPAWDEAPPEEWARLDGALDEEIWRARELGRATLVTFVRERLRAALASRGLCASDAAWVDEVLDPRFMILGFARRFAEYKRATLLLSQPERLRALLLDEHRPIQLVFAGKAHPADDLGKEMIAEVARFAADPTVRHRVVFLEDYDISVARALYQGCDVWLNTPRRPMEACGTSGEKAVLNGSLHCSVLDGWWAECFDGTNGWAVSSAESLEDIAQRDRVEADSLFEILEAQIVPLFYERDNGGFPRGWVQRIKASLSTLGPRVLASRMVSDYLETMYEPSAKHSDALSEENFARARALAEWKDRVAAAWPEVKVAFTKDHGPRLVDVGTEREVSAEVHLGVLSPDDVRVELLHGSVGAGGEIGAARAAAMSLRSGSGDGYRYIGRFTCDAAGRHGYAVRVVPSHPDLVCPTEMGLVAWA